jgi:uncharacterized cupin superfamily protein
MRSHETVIGGFGDPPRRKEAPFGCWIPARAGLSASVKGIDMVCQCIDGEMRLDHRDGHAFTVKKGDV